MPGTPITIDRGGRAAADGREQHEYRHRYDRARRRAEESIRDSRSRVRVPALRAPPPRFRPRSAPARGISCLPRRRPSPPAAPSAASAVRGSKGSRELAHVELFANKLVLLLPAEIGIGAALQLCRSHDPADRRRRVRARACIRRSAISSRCGASRSRRTGSRASAAQSLRGSAESAGTATCARFRCAVTARS